MITTLLCFVIRAYQLLISPYLPARCRYLPTCSAYALAALKKTWGG
jgi:putative membrane protein insertion efficiency factor